METLYNGSPLLVFYPRTLIHVIETYGSNASRAVGVTESEQPRQRIKSTRDRGPAAIIHCQGTQTPPALIGAQAET